MPKENKWSTEDILGMLAKNSKWEHNNQGLPSDPQMVDMISQAFANNFAEEFKNVPFSTEIWDYSRNGFMIYIGIVFNMYSGYIGGLWNYNDEFLKALGMDKYAFERMLIEAGQLAIFKDGEGESAMYVALPFTVLKKDVYNNPLKIEINAPNSEYFKDKKLNEGEFVIIRQNINSWNKLVENAPFLTMAYLSGCQFHDDIPRGQNHHIMLSDSAFDNTAAITTEVLNDFSTSRKTMLALTPQQDSQVLAGDPTARKGLDISEKFKNSLITLDYVDRTQQDWENYQNAFGEALKYLGLDSNMNAKKAERQITGEITVNAEIPSKMRAEMFYLRDYALKQANELFGVNWTIEETDDDPKQEMEIPNPAMDYKGDEDNA